MIRFSAATRLEHRDVQPTAEPSIVRHILYLDGVGRETPYHSLTEVRDVARRFAGRSGAVFRTAVAPQKANNVRHIGRLELLRLLRGRGHGDAAWPDAFEVMTARRYVELWAEHLADFRNADTLDELLAAVYERD